MQWDRHVKYISRVYFRIMWVERKIISVTTHSFVLCKQVLKLCDIKLLPIDHQGDQYKSVLEANRYKSYRLRAHLAAQL